MTYEPDFVISWDISEKDNPIIMVTKIEFDNNVKRMVGSVIETINAESAGAFSLNQLIAKYNMQELIKKREAMENEE